MRIPPADAFTTTNVWIAAIFIAIREGASTTGVLPGLVRAMSGVWSYLPIGVLTMAALLYLYRALRAPRKPVVRPAPVPAPTPAPPKPPSPPLPPPPRAYVPDAVVTKFLALMATGPNNVQQAAFLRPHLGQWMRFEGYVRSMDQAGKTILAQFNHLPAGNTGNIVVEFDVSLSAKLALVQKQALTKIDVLITNDAQSGVKFAMGELR